MALSASDMLRVPHMREKAGYITHLLSEKKYMEAFLTARVYCHEKRGEFGTTSDDVSSIKDAIEFSISNDWYGWRSAGVPLRVEAEGYLTQFAKKVFRPLASIAVGITSLALSFGTSSVLSGLGIARSAYDLKKVADHFKWEAFERKLIAPEKMNWGGRIIDLFDVGLDCADAGSEFLPLMGII